MELNVTLLWLPPPWGLSHCVTAGPRPPTPTRAFSCWIVCRSVYPPLNPALYATDRHTGGAERRSASSSACHTGSVALTHTVYRSRRRDTRKRMTTGFVCVLYAAVILIGVITWMISSGAPQSPIFGVSLLLNPPGAWKSSVH